MQEGMFGGTVNTFHLGVFKKSRLFIVQTLLAMLGHVDGWTMAGACKCPDIEYCLGALNTLPVTPKLLLDH